MTRYYNDYLIHSNDDTLTHYGVLGMKWGVRRYQNKDGGRIKSASESRSSKRAEKRKAKEEAKQFKANAKEIKKQRSNDARYSSALSDKALDKAIIRLQKEQQLKSLTRSVDAFGSVDSSGIIADTLLRNGAKLVGAVATAGAIFVGRTVIPSVLKKKGHNNAANVVANIVNEGAKLAFPKK